MPTLARAFGALEITGAHEALQVGEGRNLF